jgi:hypothetical protein
MNPLTRIIAATAYAWLLACGCGHAPDATDDPASPEAAIPPLGTIRPVSWSAPAGKQPPLPGIDQGTVYALGTAFVLWSDRGDGMSVSRSSNARGSECHGSLFGPNQRPIEFRCEIKDGKAGQATVAGITYDLANGGLLAVSTRGARVRVKQLKRDLTTLKLEQDALAAFARKDQDLVAFFTGAGQKK